MTKTKKLCPICHIELKERSTLYTRDLFRGPINEKDVSGKSPMELHGVSASGIAVENKKMSKESLENFFNSTTGIAIMTIENKCLHCGYVSEDG